MNIWKSILLLSFLLICSRSFGSDYLDKFYLEYEKSISTNRDYYLTTNQERKGALNVGFTFKPTKWLFHRNKVYSTIGTSKFAHVGLESELGVSKGLFEVYIRHRSDHALDEAYTNKFPQVNSIGIRLIMKE